jgi:hypothetical protein
MTQHLPFQSHQGAVHTLVQRGLGLKLWDFNRRSILEVTEQSDLNGGQVLKNLGEPHDLHRRAKFKRGRGVLRLNFNASAAVLHIEGAIALSEDHHPYQAARWMSAPATRNWKSSLMGLAAILNGSRDRIFPEPLYHPTPVHGVRRFGVGAVIESSGANALHVHGAINQVCQRRPRSSIHDRDLDQPVARVKREDAVAVSYPLVSDDSMKGNPLLS